MIHMSIVLADVWRPGTVQISRFYLGIQITYAYMLHTFLPWDKRGRLPISRAEGRWNAE